MGLVCSHFSWGPTVDTPTLGPCAKNNQDALDKIPCKLKPSGRQSLDKTRTRLCIGVLESIHYQL